MCREYHILCNGFVRSYRAWTLPQLNLNLASTSLDIISLLLLSESPWTLMQYSKVFAFPFIFTSSGNLINMPSIWSNDKMLWNSSGRASKMCEFHSTLQLPDFICNSEDVSFHSPSKGAHPYSMCGFHSTHHQLGYLKVWGYNHYFLSACPQCK